MKWDWLATIFTIVYKWDFEVDGGTKEGQPSIINKVLHIFLTDLSSDRSGPVIAKRKKEKECER